MDVVDDKEVLELIDRTIDHQIGDRVLAPELGEYLQKLLDSEKEEPAIQFLSEKAFQWAVKAGPTVDRIVNSDSPAWAPQILQDLVGARIHRELVDWTSKVSRQPNHEARLAAKRWLHEMANDLQNDPKTIEKVEEIKQNILAKEATSSMTEKTWENAKEFLLHTSADPNSLLRRKAHQAVMAMGHSMATSEKVQEVISERVVAAAKHLASNYAPEITGIISDTVERWDAAEASDKIEVLVGKDLQFIRMNGTVVGSLAGLLIYTIAFFVLGV